MKYITILFLLYLSFSYSQKKVEYLEGVITTYDFDTLYVKIKVFNDATSQTKIRYVDKNGKKKRIPITNIKYYTRGSEYYKTLKINTQYQLLSKLKIKGPNLNLYTRTTQGPYTKAKGFGNSIPNGEMIIITYFLENKEGRAIPVPGSNKNFEKRVSEFLKDYPEISKRIRDGELSNIEDIVNLCNELK